MTIIYKTNIIKYADISAIVLGGTDKDSFIKFIFKNSGKETNFAITRQEYADFMEAFIDTLTNDFESMFYWPLKTSETENND